MAKVTVKLTNGVSFGAIITPDAQAISDSEITVTFVGTGGAVKYPLAVMAIRVDSSKTLTSEYIDTTETGKIKIKGQFMEGDKIILIAQRAVEVTTEPDDASPVALKAQGRAVVVNNQDDQGKNDVIEDETAGASLDNGLTEVDEFGNTITKDELGNIISKVDKFGNVIVDTVE